MVNADDDQLAEVQTLIERGDYRTLSEFVREAIAEKLDRLRQSWLAEEVERYCEAGEEEEDDLVSAQAFGDEPPARTRPKTRTRKKPASGGRAKR